MSGVDQAHLDREWDRLLSAAVQARPEAVWGGGAELAAVAMDRGRGRVARVRKMQRIARWVRWSSVMAAALLAVVVICAVWWERQLNAAGAGQVMLQTNASTGNASASNVSGIGLAGIALLLVVGGILVKEILSGERGSVDMGRMVQMG